MAKERETLLRLENVGHIYGLGSGYEKTALKNINLEISEGEFIGIIGHTGSGKSTLAQLFNGLKKPTSGTVYYREKDIAAGTFSPKKLCSRVGLVFQYPEHQLFETSVIRDVEFGPRNLGLDNLEVEYRSFTALEQVGIGEHLLDVSPFTLSGGEMRRVAIAGVLAMKPEMLVLDEPTAGLDPAGRRDILELLKRLHRKEHITILMISHSMEDVARYTERLLVMNQGEIVLDGKPEKIFQYEQELRRIGLGVPRAVRVMHMLRANGMKVRADAVTPEEAADEIAEYLRGK